jgi:PAS domain S-box-containing protein
VNRSDLLQFRAVFFEAADAMLIVDDERAVVEANTAACVLFHMRPEEMRGRLLEELLLDDREAVSAAWREVIALGEAKREHRVRAAGVPRFVECTYRARVHNDRHLCVARDITERRALEERVNESEKIQSVGRLAGGIAHDFNNLLTAILGYTEMLLSHRTADDPDRNDLEEIQRAGQRAAALTQQLLAFGRRQVLLPKNVDLNETVGGLQSMLGRLIREDITLHVDLAPAPAVVCIDPAQIEQAILNLVLNARDALPGGGHIRLEVARMPRSQVDGLPDYAQGRLFDDADRRAIDGGPAGTAWSGAAEYVRLLVSDTGIGIAPEIRPHIFEPFFTTKAVGRGTGLGLASVYGIVRQSNGSIAVVSEPGQGTTFTMYFPAVPTPCDLDSAAGPAEPARGRETILLVEDEDSVRAIIGAVLRRHGYEVLDASNAGTATELFERHGATIDLLLTDVVMPEISGPALASRLIALRPDLRVLFVSGYGEMSIPELAGSAGVLSKPFQASTLVDRVRRALAAPSRAAANS